MQIGAPRFCCPEIYALRRIRFGDLAISRFADLWLDSVWMRWSGDIYKLVRGGLQAVVVIRSPKMPSAQSPLVLLLLLPLLILSQCLLAATQVPPPRRDLQTPNFDGESFERFDGTSRENSSEMREQLKQLLSEQLANAFAPLATTPFANLAQRQPGIVAPTSGEAARAQFSGESASSEEADTVTEAENEEEEESPEDENSSEEEPATPPTPQPPLPAQLPQPVDPVDPDEDQDPEPVAELEEYNAWRDNFYDLNEDGSYIFGWGWLIIIL